MRKISKFTSIILLSLLLFACALGENDKEETCCGYVTDSNLGEYEQKARSGDDEAMLALSNYYSEKIPDRDASKDDLATAKGDAADKARYWAEQSIKAGKRTTLDYYTSNYIDRSRDQTLPMAERRGSLIQALWTWQRLSPDNNKGKYWRRLSNEIPHKIDRSATLDSNQDELHNIIFAMRDLENEAAKAK